MQTDELFLTLDSNLLEDLEPDLVAPEPFWREILGRPDNKRMNELGKIAIFLSIGVPGPAIVTQLDPLVIGAYCGENDKLALLRFSPAPKCAARLVVGARLLCVSTFDETFVRDLVGGNTTSEFSNIKPLIGEFLSMDTHLIAKRLAAFSSSEWKRCEELCQEAARDKALKPRNGRPTKCGIPCSKLPRML